MIGARNIAMWRCGDAAISRSSSAANSSSRQITKSPHLIVPVWLASSRAFTLVELMVVLAVIFALLALTVGVSVTLRRGSDVRETENVLKLLDAALQDWEASSERQLTWGPEGFSTGTGTSLHFDLDSAKSGEEQMSQLLAKLNAVASSRQILSQINQRFLIKKPAQGSQPERLLVKDPWGKEIVVLHPGHLPNASLFPGDASTQLDADGTIRTSPSHPQSPSIDASEERFGVCVNRHICFLSAGPDLRFGNLTANEDANNDGVPDHMDNITSYPLQPTKSTP
jgi:type II secretory pathway pseudopilin PulG